MQIGIEFNGALRRLAGRADMTIDVPETAVVGDVLNALERVVPDLAALLETSACAVGDSLVSRRSGLSDGDRLVLLPPVSGG